MRGYLATQRALQRDLRCEVGASDEELRRNQRLISTWDWLSLALCLGWAPSSLGELRLGAGNTLARWPFGGVDEVEVRCEGRRLEGRYADEPSLHAALERAPRVELRFSLRAGGPRT